MAYRGGVESVLRRCEDARERLHELRRDAPARECRSLAAALAWERELVTQLDAADSEASELAGVAVGEATATPPAALRNAVRGGLAAVGLVALAAIGLAVYLVEARQPSSEAQPHEASYLLAANVVSTPHRGDRCTIALDWDAGACDLDVICPTVERRFHAERCRRGSAVAASIPGALDFDGEHGTMSFAVEGEPTVRLELDAWR